MLLTAAPDLEMSEALAPVTSMLSTIAPFIATVGALFMALGLVKWLFGRYSYGGGGNFGLILAGLPLFVVGMLLTFSESIFGVDAETEEPAAAPSPTVVQEPEKSTPVELTTSFDFSIPLLILAILAGVLLLFGIGYVLTRFIGAARKSQKLKQEAQEELRAKVKAAEETWAKVRERHKELLGKILWAETDWDALFSFPSLTDVSVPETAALFTAMEKANHLRDNGSDEPTFRNRVSTPEEILSSSYAQAVEAFALAWAIAERKARRVGQKTIPRAERALLKEAKTLLALVENGSASETERRLAYKRVRSLLAKLEHVHVPERAFLQLEEKQLLSITA